MDKKRIGYAIAAGLLLIVVAGLAFLVESTKKKNK